MIVFDIRDKDNKRISCLREYPRIGKSHLYRINDIWYSCGLKIVYTYSKNNFEIKNIIKSGSSFTEAYSFWIKEFTRN